MGQIFLGESQSHINPHMHAKFGCGQTVVSEKWGVQTHTYARTNAHTHTHSQTKGRCSLIDNSFSSSSLSHIYHVVMMYSSPCRSEIHFLPTSSLKTTGRNMHVHTHTHTHTHPHTHTHTYTHRLLGATMYVSVRSVRLLQSVPRPVAVSSIEKDDLPGCREHTSAHSRDSPVLPRYSHALYSHVRDLLLTYRAFH